MQFLISNKSDSLKHHGERHYLDDTTGRWKNLRLSKRYFTAMICSWIWLLCHAVPRRLRKNIERKPSMQKFTEKNHIYAYRKLWLPHNKIFNTWHNGNRSVNAIYPVCNWRTIGQWLKLKGRKFYKEKKFKEYCCLIWLVTFMIQDIRY